MGKGERGEISTREGERLEHRMKEVGENEGKKSKRRKLDKNKGKRESRREK